MANCSRVWSILVTQSFQVVLQQEPVYCHVLHDVLYFFVHVDTPKTK